MFSCFSIRDLILRLFNSTKNVEKDNYILRYTKEILLLSISSKNTTELACINVIAKRIMYNMDMIVE